MRKVRWDPESWNGNVCDPDEAPSSESDTEQEGDTAARLVVEQLLTGPNAASLQGTTTSGDFKASELQDVQVAAGSRPVKGS